MQNWQENTCVRVSFLVSYRLTEHFRWLFLNEVFFLSLFNIFSLYEVIFEIKNEVSMCIKRLLYKKKDKEKINLISFLRITSALMKETTFGSYSLQEITVKKRWKSYWKTKMLFTFPYYETKIIFLFKLKKISNNNQICSFFENWSSWTSILISILRMKCKHE